MLRLDLDLFVVSSFILFVFIFDTCGVYETATWSHAQLTLARSPQSQLRTYSMCISTFQLWTFCPHLWPKLGTSNFELHLWTSPHDNLSRSPSTNSWRLWNICLAIWTSCECGNLAFKQHMYFFCCNWQSGNVALWQSVNLAIWQSGNLAPVCVKWNHLESWQSGNLAIWPSGNQVGREVGKTSKYDNLHL